MKKIFFTFLFLQFLILNSLSQFVESENSSKGKKFHFCPGVSFGISFPTNVNTIIEEQHISTNVVNGFSSVVLSYGLKIAFSYYMSNKMIFSLDCPVYGSLDKVDLNGPYWGLAVIDYSEMFSLARISPGIKLDYVFSSTFSFDSFIGAGVSYENVILGDSGDESLWKGSCPGYTINIGRINKVHKFKTFIAFNFINAKSTDNESSKETLGFSGIEAGFTGYW